MDLARNGGVEWIALHVTDKHKETMVFIGVLDLGMGYVRYFSLSSIFCGSINEFMLLIIPCVVTRIVYIPSCYNKDIILKALIEPWFPRGIAEPRRFQRLF